MSDDAYIPTGQRVQTVLDTLDRQCLLAGDDAAALLVAVSRHCLEQLAGLRKRPDKGVVFASVVAVVADVYHIAEEDIMGRVRIEPVATARHMLCLVLHRHYAWRVIQIARVLVRDHGAVSSSIQRMIDLIHTDPKAAEAYAAIKRQLHT